MKLLKKAALLTVTSIALTGMAQTAAWAAPKDASDPISIVLNDWPSQLVTAYIAGDLFEKMGHKVNYVQADTMAQFAGLQTGDLAVQVEIWPTTQWARFTEAVNSGNVLDLGESGVAVREEWWYPDYMVEYCPGLPDWTALKDPKCAEAFSSVETAPKGLYLGAPVSSEGFDEERVKALGLPFEVVHAGSDMSLVGEITSAYRRKAPIMAWFWVPHWWPTQMKGDFVQFPKYEPACYEDPSWGINPDMAHDCGKPVGILHKAAWAGGKEIWPDAYAMLSKMALTDDMAAEFFRLVEQDGQEPQDVAKQWIKDNEAVWSQWMK